MQYMRCQCGKSEYFHSGMHPKDCQGCDECGTTLGYGPSDHKPRVPHKWETRYNTKTGKPERLVCSACHESGEKL